MKGQLAVTTPEEYLAKLDEPRKSDVAALDRLIRKVLSLEPFIHSGMLAYGPVHLKYKTGKELDWFKVGLASNARYISLYACAADERGYVAERYKERLPGANIGKSCVRFKKLADLDEKALIALLEETKKTSFGQ